MRVVVAIAGAGVVVFGLVRPCGALVVVLGTATTIALGLDTTAVLITPWGSLATLLWAERWRAAGVAVPWTTLAAAGTVLLALLLAATVPLLPRTALTPPAPPLAAARDPAAGHPCRSARSRRPARRSARRRPG